MGPSTSFPFSSVVGQDELKLALLLAAIDPAIGGVLVRGEKGSGKTTLARALAGLLPGDAPFVELPLGATEDRVLGSIDVAATLTSGGEVVRRGLLATADGGVLYVDEVNLLADHIVDTLLDVAASGRHRLERDGISVEQPARFVLLGTMNPEEGELRPQLLDRFGLCVPVTAPTDIDARAEIVLRRFAHDSGRAAQDGFADSAVRERLAGARPAALDTATIRFASALAVAAGVEGVRADLVLCRTAAAYAGWEGRTVTTTVDVERVAALVLAHRRRRSPFDPPSMPPDELERAIDEARGSTNVERPMELGAESGAPPMPPARRRVAAPDGATGRRDVVQARRGRLVRDIPYGDARSTGIAVAATVRAFVRRRTDDPGATPSAGDLRGAVREDRAGALVVIALDTSGSMGSHERVQAATGAVLGMLTDAYQRRDRVAVVAFGGDGARVALAPTGSVEVARARLTELATGGSTPLAEGLTVALDVCGTAAASTPARRAVLAVVTDGRATGDEGAFADALSAARAVRAAGVTSVVLDAETGTPRLGLAAELAAELGAPCHPLESLSSTTLRDLVGAVR